MRELKFRQWNDFEFNYFDLRDKFGDADWAMLDHEDVIEQYTGLKDKNGVEIYEGDILQLDRTHVKAFRRVVGFQEGKFGYADPVVAGVWYALTGLGASGKWKWSVIGNVHETPELIPK